MGLPLKKIYGTDVDPSMVGPRQVVAVPATKSASPPIQLDRFCRNGRHPDASFANALAEATNDLVATMDADGYLLTLNTAGYRMLGLDFDTVVPGHGNVTTKASLADAFAHALKRQGLTLVRAAKA